MKTFGKPGAALLFAFTLGASAGCSTTSVNNDAGTSGTGDAATGTSGAATGTSGAATGSSGSSGVGGDESTTEAGASGGSGSTSNDGGAATFGDATADDSMGAPDAALDSSNAVTEAETDADAGPIDGSVEPSSIDAGCVSGPNLIVNGSFEEPTVPVGSFQTFAVGSSFTGWTVVGIAGNVAPLSTAYTANGLHWTAECGMQTLDLTGLSNTATGVSQTVATTAGTPYTLTFWVGNLVDPAAGWGSTSTVDVLVNDNNVLTATNSSGTGATSLDWQLYTVQFTASSSSTTIAFLNGDPSTDNSNIIDNVILN